MASTVLEGDEWAGAGANHTISSFLPWNEFIQVWLLDIKDWLNQENPEDKQGQEIPWRELDTAEEGQPAMPEKGLQKQGKGEGTRYPSPAVACAAPSPCWKWQHFDTNDTKLLSHHHVPSFSQPSRRNNTHWNQETLIYKWQVVWLQVGHLTSDSVFWTWGKSLFCLLHKPVATKEDDINENTMQTRCDKNMWAYIIVFPLPFKAACH